MPDGESSGAEVGEVPEASLAPSRRQFIVQAGEARMASIESLRAIAALSVLAFHVYGTATAQHGQPLNAQPIEYRALFSGRYGVCLFFAITGYVLFRPFAEAHLAGADKVDLRRYARNRALRILPLYYVVLLSLVLAAGGGIHASEVLRFALFLENYSRRTIFGIDGPMWSLVVEVQYYVLLPLIAVTLARVGRRDPWRWITCLLVVGVASCAARWALVYAVHPGAGQAEWTTSLPTNLMFFVPGMMLAVLGTRTASAPASPASRVLQSARLWLLGAALLWPVAIFAWPTVQTFEMAALVCSFLTLGACVLPLSPSRGLAVLRLRPLALLGLISYSVYLWHGDFVLMLVPRHSSPLLSLILILPVCVGWSVVSYLVIERPFLRRRRPAQRTVPGPPVIVAAPQS